MTIIAACFAAGLLLGWGLRKRRGA